MTKDNKTATVSNSAVKRLVMLFKGKWRFINYRKKFNGEFPLGGWKPSFTRMWMGDIWEITWRGFGIGCDMRKCWMADMIDPNMTNRH